MQVLHVFLLFWICVNIFCRIISDLLFDFAEACNVSQYFTRLYPCRFDFWMSEDHWVNSYPCYILVLKLILLSFFHHRLCTNSTFRCPWIDMTCCATLSSNLPLDWPKAMYHVPENVFSLLYLLDVSCVSSFVLLPISLSEYVSII